jgi:branched-chain amino acid transport system ATP-binding protein
MSNMTTQPHHATVSQARNPLLSVTGLSAGYGRIPILSGISLSVGDGEFVGILGHNGMGKTTLLKALMGYLPATKGKVNFNGRDITTASPTVRARANIGYVPQGREIFPALTVHENLRMGCLLARRDEAATIEDILGLFPRLKAYLERPGGALSGGEQQLLALARCLCGAPKIVLLDEPTEGIQPSIIEEIIETLQKIGRKRGLTVLLVEQNLNFISSLSQRVLILQKGMITQEILPELARDRALIDEFVGMT